MEAHRERRLNICNSSLGNKRCPSIKGVRGTERASRERRGDPEVSSFRVWPPLLVLERHSKEMGHQSPEQGPPRKLESQWICPEEAGTMPQKQLLPQEPPRHGRGDSMPWLLTFFCILSPSGISHYLNLAGSRLQRSLPNMISQVSAPATQGKVREGGKQIQR